MKKNLPLKEQNPIEDFCIDNCFCQKRYPSPEFPSPTSCLPLQTLKQVREDIRSANQLLLDLALDVERTPAEIFRNAFRGLDGLMVTTSTIMGRTIDGKVHTVGFDFVVLLADKSEIILPYRQIISVKPKGRFAEPNNEAPLRNIDGCLRRDITFCFGSIVSSSPKLLHLFYRMRFNIYLLLLENKKVDVSVDETVIRGIVEDVDKNSIAVMTDNELTIISNDKISMIQVMEDKGASEYNSVLDTGET
ncbi:hypothetical protein [Lentibacillus sp. Marseille-P4043]|uniref:hypothetical protein n=1 Tax=Lentibacillus sp. Marseille-P4043 TaxID=2040293 RepID=UPI000D0AF8EA|nr:hypothetical protein [Lentibacillus sp. Marseille-P4043]